MQLLQAVQWVGAAWNEVSADTITKCFKKAGFTSHVGDTNNDAEQSVIDINTEAEPSVNDINTVAELSGEVSPALQQISRDLYDCNFEEFTSVDEYRISLQFKIFSKDCYNK